jgi:hypothetical protein
MSYDKTSQDRVQSLLSSTEVCSRMMLCAFQLGNDTSKALFVTSFELEEVIKIDLCACRVVVKRLSEGGHIKS